MSKPSSSSSATRLQLFAQNFSSLQTWLNPTLSLSARTEDDIDDDTDSEQEEEEEDTTSMSTATKVTPTPEGVNAVQVVYEKIKDVWTWGKTVPVVSTLEDVTEKVAIKISGSTLSDIDGGIRPYLMGVDTAYVNPAVKALVDFLMPLVSKADSTLKPFIEAISKKLPMIKSDKKEMSPSPELTTAPVTVN